MKIKISLLSSLLHESNSFDEENAKFIKEIEDKLNTSIEVAPIDDYDCDVKLILIASGGSEGLFLNAIDKLQEPYYLLTKGTNNSLAASLEIMTYLNNHKLKGEVFHGDASFIADRIINISKESKSNKKYVRLGVIGKPSDWLISSIPSYEAIKETFNIDLIDIDLNEVIDEYHKQEIRTAIDPINFNPSEVTKAEKFINAVREIVKKYQLKGFTIRCFDLLEKIKTTGCLALAKLNAEGIIGTCEGDIMALVCMYLVKNYFNKSSFQANPSSIDIDKKEVIFAHCTVPYDLCTSYKYDTHFESKIGVAVKGELETRQVGVFRISSDLKHYFFHKGVIVENLSKPNLCRTQIKVRFDDDISSLLTNPCGNHHIIFYL